MNTAKLNTFLENCTHIYGEPRATHDSHAHGHASSYTQTRPLFIKKVDLQVLTTLPRVGNK